MSVAAISSSAFSSKSKAFWTGISPSHSASSRTGSFLRSSIEIEASPISSFSSIFMLERILSSINTHSPCGSPSTMPIAVQMPWATRAYVPLSLLCRRSSRNFCSAFLFARTRSMISSVESAYRCCALAFAFLRSSARRFHHSFVAATYATAPRAHIRSVFIRFAMLLAMIKQRDQTMRIIHNWLELSVE